MTTFSIIVAECFSWHRPRKLPIPDVPESCACVDQVRPFANPGMATALSMWQCDPKGPRQVEVGQEAAIQGFGTDRDAFSSPLTAMIDNNQYEFYCAFDLRARSMSGCVVDHDGNIVSITLLRDDYRTKPPP
jgi:hypothetical protein